MSFHIDNVGSQHVLGDTQESTQDRDPQGNNDFGKVRTFLLLSRQYQSDGIFVYPNTPSVLFPFFLSRSIVYTLSSCVTTYLKIIGLISSFEEEMKQYMPSAR